MARYVLRHYEFLRSLVLFHDYDYAIQEIVGMTASQVLAIVAIVRRLLDGVIAVTPAERRRFLRRNPHNAYLSALRHLGDPRTTHAKRKRLLIRHTPLIPFILQRDHVNQVRDEALFNARRLARATG